MENKEIKKTNNSKASDIVCWLVMLAVTGVIMFNQIADYKVPYVEESDIKAKEIEISEKEMFVDFATEEDFKQPKKYDSVYNYYYIESSEKTILAQEELKKAIEELEQLQAYKRKADSMLQIPKCVRFKENIRNGLINYHTKRLNALTR